MSKKNLLMELIKTFQNKLPLPVKVRESKIPLNSREVVSVCGVRRCGKTYIIYDTINRLFEQGVTRDRILFLNFDDERLDFPPIEFDLILQAYRELYPHMDMSKVYIFFDEIQMADGWERFVRRIYETETRHIFVSGSNSRLLATDIASCLRGRSVQFETFPLDFKEFCKFKNIDINFYDPKSRAILSNEFKLFNRGGGFPDIVLCEDRQPEKILQEYFHLMLYKDLIERFEIKNIPVLKYLIARMLENITKSTSINKIYNEVRSAGLKTDKNLLYDLTDNINAIYFAFRMGKNDKSVLKTELSNEKKIYVIDNGLINALSYGHQENFGKLLENTVFLHLRRKVLFQRGLYFYKGKKECDFVLFDLDKPECLIQVCYDMTNCDTRNREIAGLMEAANYYNCKDLMIITAEQEEEIKVEGRIIRVVPAWKALLS